MVPRARPTTAAAPRVFIALALALAAFFTVYKSLDSNTTARAFVFDSRNSSIRQVLGRPAGSQIRLYANADLDFPFITYPFAGYSTWAGIYDGTSSALYRDGALVGSGY